MMKNRKVSIITVSFNSADTIARTIDSVLNQTYDNVEYLIIDGGSTDGTNDIINGYKDRFSLKPGYELIHVSEPDDGIYDAMNKGINLSSGALIGIINSDDYYEYNAIEIMINTWESVDYSEYVILHGLLRQLRGGIEYSVVLNKVDFIYEKMIQHPTCFVPRTVYEKIGLFNTRYKYVADAEFLMRAYEAGIGFIPVYKIIAAFESGGLSETTAAIQEAYRLKYEKGKMSWLSFYLLRTLDPVKSFIYRRLWN